MRGILTASTHWSFAVFVCVLGISQILLGETWIPLLPIWTGYLPVPGILLVHLGGLTKILFGSWLWFKDLAHVGAFCLLVFSLLSYSAHPTDAVIKSLCIIGALSVLATEKK
jgi:hypothetical protein